MNIGINTKSILTLAFQKVAILYFKVNKVFWALLLKGGAVFSGLLLNLLLANKLGASGSGIFYLMFTLVIIASSISRLGTDQSLIKYSSLHENRNDSDSLAVFIFSLVFFIASILATFTYINASHFAELLFKDSSITKYIILTTPAIVTSSLYIVASVSLQAKGFAKLYVFCVSVLMPLILLIQIFLADLDDIEKVIRALNISCLITFIITIFIWKINSNTFDFYRGFSLTKKLVKNSGYYASFGLLILINQWIPQLAVAHYLDMSDVGIFSTAQRISFLFTSLIVALNAVYSTRLVSTASNGNRDSLLALLKNICFVVIFMGLTALIILMTLSPHILRLFGEEFTPGINTLRILSVAQFIYIFPSVLSWVLLAKNKQNLLLISALTMLAINVITNIFLTSSFGILGASISQLISFISFLLFLLFFCARYALK